MKTLFFGDCLTYLKDLVPNPHKSEGFIDLIYIDPPFNSKRDYNILFEDIDLKDATAQKQAFADTWSNVSYIDTLRELNKLDLNLFTFLETLNNINISKSAVSYLTTMAIRIYYMHKVLKDTGSFYLHCDPTMSHYLKIVCDLIFGKENFINEILWCYKTRHFSKRHFGRKHDVILFYAKSEKYTFNWESVMRPLSESTIKKYKLKDEKGLYRLSGRGIKGSPIQSAKDVDPEYEITHPHLVVREYLKDGVPIEDYWNIDILNQVAIERLGYPTQKPEALLERIIKASSNEGDLVADFFCGCGTSIAVAERLNRQWLGVDISHLAIKLIKKRLIDKIEDIDSRKSTELRKEYAKSIEIKGFPQDIASARALAKEDYDIQDEERTDAEKVEDKKAEKKKTKGRVLFQEWIVEVMLGAVLNPKLTADGGWDGHQVFDIGGDKKETVLIEVKSGHCNVKNIREFIHVVDAQKAAIGVFVCFGEQVTRPMLEEASKQGYYEIQNVKNKYPKIQILTVEDILNGQEIKMPLTTADVFKKSQKSTTQKPDKQQKIF
jgi:site-specific DNA-methyltransferase (adenine-specific)